MKVHKILLLHFLILIFLCTIFLKLPFSWAEGKKISLINALFISTSAVCVTGLSPLDIGSTLSPLGKVLLLLFIQVGGLSLASFFIFFSYITAHKLNLFQRKLILSTYSSALKQDFKPLIFSIVIASFIIEIIGAILLFFPFLKRHSPLQALWYSLFHSISAFCNAGFSLYEQNLMVWSDNPFVVFVFSILIFLGGIGFIVISEIFIKIKTREKLSLHSFITLKATLILIILGTLLFLIFEWNGVLRERNLFQKFYISLFHSLTPRTCGFNLLNIGSLGFPALFLTMVLMFIGASPGSTGGGIKTTTFYIIFLKIISKFHGENQTHIKNKADSNKTVENGFQIFFIALFLIFTIFILILIFDGKNFKFQEILFEVISAFGTVGLSCGITSYLSTFSKVFIIVLMYFGRIGGLVILSILQEERKTLGVIYTEENVLIG